MQRSWWTSWWVGSFCRALDTAAPQSSPITGLHCSAAAAALTPRCGHCCCGGWRWNRRVLAVKRTAVHSGVELSVAHQDWCLQAYVLEAANNQHIFMGQTSCIESSMVQSMQVRATAMSHVFKLSIRAALCCSSELSVKRFWRGKEETILNKGWVKSFSLFQFSFRHHTTWRFIHIFKDTKKLFKLSFSLPLSCCELTKDLVSTLHYTPIRHNIKTTHWWNE